MSKIRRRYSASTWFMTLVIASISGLLIAAVTWQYFQLQALSASLQEIRDNPPVELTTPSLTVSPVDSYAPAVRQAASSVVSIYTARQVEPQLNSLNQWFNRRYQQRRLPQISTSSASGVIFDDQGHILTNYHVIQSSEAIRVATVDGHDYPAKLIGSDPETDLAVIKVDFGDEQLTPIGFQAAQHKPHIGDIVLAIGNPYGVGQTVTMGIVSATGRDRLGLNTFENFIQTDAAINPGNSGGALVNAQGQLIGINTAIFSQDGGYQGIGLAIPLNMAMDIYQQIVSNGAVIRGWLGVSGRDLPPALSRTYLKDSDIHQGTIVINIYPGSPADKAGLKAGDIIVRINNEEISDTREVLNNIAMRPPGSQLNITYIRNKETIKTTATLSQRPASS